MLTDIQKIIQLMEHRKAKAIKHRNNNWDKGYEVAGYEFEGMSRAFAADIRLLKLFLKKWSSEGRRDSPKGEQSNVRKADVARRAKR